MKWFSKKKPDIDKRDMPINCTLDDMKEAIRKWEDDQAKGIYRTILVNDDYSIDPTLLISYLGGVPTNKFYMSKKTYELFEEKDKELAMYFDVMQEAVDKFIQTEKKLPVIDFDKNYRLNYFMLESMGYIKEKPPHTFYLVPKEENMISLNPPES